VSRRKPSPADLPRPPPLSPSAEALLDFRRRIATRTAKDHAMSRIDPVIVTTIQAYWDHAAHDAGWAWRTDSASGALDVEPQDPDGDLLVVAEAALSQAHAEGECVVEVYRGEEKKLRYRSATDWRWLS
jgi:hypothetical protein